MCCRFNIEALYVGAEARARIKKSLRWSRNEGGEVGAQWVKPNSPPWRYRLRWWAIRLVVGKCTVVMNAHVAGIQIPPGTRGAIIYGNTITP